MRQWPLDHLNGEELIEAIQELLSQDQRAERDALKAELSKSRADSCGCCNLHITDGFDPATATSVCPKCWDDAVETGELRKELSKLRADLATARDEAARLYSSVVNAREQFDHRQHLKAENEALKATCADLLRELDEARRKLAEADTHHTLFAKEIGHPITSAWAELFDVFVNSERKLDAERADEEIELADLREELSQLRAAGPRFKLHDRVRDIDEGGTGQVRFWAYSVDFGRSTRIVHEESLEPVEAPSNGE